MIFDFKNFQFKYDSYIDCIGINLANIPTLAAVKDKNPKLFDALLEINSDAIIIASLTIAEVIISRGIKGNVLGNLFGFDYDPADVIERCKDNQFLPDELKQEIEHFLQPMAAYHV